MRRAELSADGLAGAFSRVRAVTKELLAPLSAEDMQIQSMPDASPTKWHLAHTTWFFEEFVLSRDGAYRRFHERFSYLFNSYYDSVGERQRRPERGLLSRPTVAEIFEYRAYVDAHVSARLREGALAPEAMAALELGLHHEQQHQELLLTDILHAFSRNALRPAYASTPVPRDGSAEPATWLRQDGGLVEIGAKDEGFAFDNERPIHRAYVHPFALASRLVTQHEYAAFIEDGGYQRSELWLSDGWDRVRTEGWRAPLYWQREEDRWKVFGLHGLNDATPNAPVLHVSLYEADAYARWANARLPSEQEWELAARDVPVAGNLMNAQCFAPRAAAASGKLEQLFGDAWEWTASSFAPYPGFTPLEGALGEYNAKFMCSQYVLRGGSFATPPSHIRATYRNFFPPATRWQFSGIRLARDAQ